MPHSDFWINEQQAPGTTSFLPFPKDMRPAAAGISRIPPSSAAPSRTSLPMMDMITSRNRDEKDKTPENDSLSSLGMRVELIVLSEKIMMHLVTA